MYYLGEIIKTRDDAVRPLEVLFDLGDMALETGWMMVAAGVWATVKFSDLKPGVQVTVWDTGIVGDPDKYRVAHVWPTGGLTLEDNRHRLARRGDAVAIRGNPKLTQAAATTILAGVPPILPLGHDLTGQVVDDE